MVVPMVTTELDLENPIVPETLNILYTVSADDLSEAVALYEATAEIGTQVTLANLRDSGLLFA